jgi:hypothetical protein
MSGLLYLGAFHFDGDPGELLPGYHRLLEQFPIDALDVHLCITHDNGLTIFDACPTKAIHEQFTKTRSPERGCPRRASRVSAMSRRPISVRRSAHE